MHAQIHHVVRAILEGPLEPLERSVCSTGVVVQPGNVERLHVGTARARRKRIGRATRRSLVSTFSVASYESCLDFRVAHRGKGSLDLRQCLLMPSMSEGEINGDAAAQGQAYDASLLNLQPLEQAV